MGEGFRQGGARRTVQDRDCRCHSWTSGWLCGSTVIELKSGAYILPFCLFQSPHDPPMKQVLLTVS